jgi:hypothetical protein
MSPNNKNKTGGTRGRAALTLRGEAARTGEMQVLANAVTMLGVTVALFLMSAPELWPRLFPGH